MIKIPAVAKEDEKIFWKNHLTDSEVCTERKKGDLLHPMFEGEKEISELMNGMGTLFEAQYQQNPMPSEGAMIKRNFLSYYNKIEKSDFSRIVISCDTALKSGENNAYSVFEAFLISTDNQYAYLVDIFREKIDSADLPNELIKFGNSVQQNYGVPLNYLIEDKSSGTTLIQTLQNRRQVNVISHRPIGSKEDRLQGVSHLIKQRVVRFPQNRENWIIEFEKELLSFPNSKYKDQCDALSQFLEYMSNLESSKQKPISYTPKRTNNASNFRSTSAGFRAARRNTFTEGRRWVKNKYGSSF